MLEFVNIPYIDTSQAIDEYRRETRSKRKSGFLLAKILKDKVLNEMFPTVYMGYCFAKEPTLDELRILASKEFNKTYRKTCEEYTPDSCYYTDSRRAAIEGIVRDYILIKLNDGSLYPVDALLQQEEMEKEPVYDDKIHIARLRNGKIRIYTSRQDYVIQTSYKPIGKFDIKRCPFCGSFDIVINGPDESLDYFLIRCRCGVKIVGRPRAYEFNLSYEDVARAYIDRWNSRV